MRLSNELSKSFTAATKDDKITAAEAKGLMKASMDEIKSSTKPAEKLDAVQARVRQTLGKDHFIQNSTEEKFEDFAKARTVKQAEAIYDELASIKTSRRKKTGSTGSTGSAYGSKGSSGKTGSTGSSAYGSKGSSGTSSSGKTSSGYGSKGSSRPARTHGRSTT